MSRTRTRNPSGAQTAPSGNNVAAEQLLGYPLSRLRGDQKSTASRYDLFQINGGEGILSGERYSVYGLKEPWADGRTFYVGVAVDVAARLKQHIAEAKDSCLTLTKNPNLGVFIATFLNGCAGTARVLEANRDNPTLSRFFYPAPEAYKAARGTYCDARYDAVQLDCGWLVHKWLEKKELLKIMTALHSVGGLFDKAECPEYTSTK